MKLSAVMKEMIGDSPGPKAPRILMWMPPNGAPIECPTMEEAAEMAPQIAARQPGRTVAVYELVGYAHAPVRAPEYQQSVTEVAAEIPDMRRDEGES